MADKINVLCLSIWYPFSLSRYFERALKRRFDVDLKTCGVYTGSWIPWLHGINLSEKYAIPPTIPLPFRPDIGKVPYPLVKTQLDDWKPDIVLTIDAGINWIDKPDDGVVATVATDAHCLNYDHARRISDKFFNLHPAYSQSGDIRLLYAYDPFVHFPDDSVEKDADAVLIGMPYPQRKEWVEHLRQRGVTVLFENGPVFDEYRDYNNRAYLGLNWSSMNDLNARVFELMAMKLCPIINRVPDLPLAGFVENKHYLGFGTMDEAVNKVIYAKEHSAIAESMARDAYDSVRMGGHTYDDRIVSIFRECGF